MVGHLLPRPHPGGGGGREEGGRLGLPALNLFVSVSVVTLTQGLLYKASSGETARTGPPHH